MMVDPYHAGLRDSQREWHVMNNAGGKEADDFFLFVTCATLMIGGETRLWGLNCRKLRICLV